MWLRRQAYVGGCAYAYAHPVCPFPIFQSGLLTVPLSRYLERGTLFYCPKCVFDTGQEDGRNVVRAGMGKWEYRGQWSPEITGRRHAASANKPFADFPRIIRIVSVGKKVGDNASARREPTQVSQVSAMREKLLEKVAAIGGASYFFCDKPVNFTGKRPVALFVGETEYPIRNWRDLIVKACDEIAKSRLQVLMDRMNIFVRSHIAKKPDGMRTPYKHEPSGLYLELYLPPISHVNHARELFEKCGYNTRAIGLAYVSEASDYAQTHKMGSIQQNVNVQKSCDLSAFNPNEIAVVRKVFEQNFTNGMRVESIIDQNKFRRCYERGNGVPLRDDFEFKIILPALGVVQGEKVYPLADANGEALKLVQESIAAGHAILFYDEIYAKHSDRLKAIGVQSGDLLCALLQKTAPSQYDYGKDYLSTNADVSIPDLIERGFAEGQVQATYEEAASWLPYIPACKVKDWVGWDRRFQKMGGEKFALARRIALDDAECHAMVQTVRGRIATDGFASKWCVELPKSRTLNEDCSENVLNEIFYDRYLANEFDRKGLIITRKGETLDIVAVCLKYCEGKDRIQKDDLVAFVHELGAGRAVALGTASSVMVRVNEDEFAAEHLVQFDVDGIDNVLNDMVAGAFLPVSSFNNFVMFPEVSGFTWNQHLLSSYCRRFSKRFKLMDGQDEGYARDNVCGAIVRNDSGIDDYVKLQVEAVRQASVELTSEAVGDFLFENKYVLRRRGMVNEVLDTLMKS